MRRIIKLTAWTRVHAGLSALLMLGSACGDWEFEFGSSGGGSGSGDSPDTDAGTTGVGGGSEGGSSTTDANTSAATDTGAATDESTGTEGAVCNNAVVEGDEECDREDLAGADCVSLGFDGGVLSCTEDCTFDTSACVIDACGNDQVDEGELCDGTDLAGEDCLTQGFAGGDLACASDCTAFDVSGCDDFTGECCAANGTPGCDNATCTAAICQEDPFCCGTSWDGVCATKAENEPACAGVDDSCPGGSPCNNGMIDMNEVCDGDDLAGQTCATQGFEGGTLACADGCEAFDTSSCTTYAGDCCTANGSVGCNDPACVVAICMSDPFCCNIEWDDVCQNNATAEAACSCS